MVRRCVLSALVVGMAASASPAFIDTFRPETLGAMCARADSITVVKIDRLSKENGVIVYRTVEALKGKFPRDTIREVLGSAHLAPEKKHYLDWAEEGKMAVIFRYENRIALCIDRQTSVCDQAPPKDEGELWTVTTRTEPFFRRSYYGDPEKLAAAVKDVLAGKEVVIPCMTGERDKELRADGGKVVHVRVGSERKDYNLKRDLVPDDEVAPKDK